MATRIDPCKSPQIQEAVARAEGRLGDSGRIVLRPSGTEPVIRVMVEGSDDKLVREIAKELAASVASRPTERRAVGEIAVRLGAPPLSFRASFAAPP